MDKEERVKISEAINLCESRMHSFFKYLDTTVGKPHSTKLAQFLLANSYFAGGVFRSTLTGTPVNDIDVWFKSLDAVIEFKHLVYASKASIFPEITKNETFNWKPGNNKGPALTFITQNYGDPDQLLSKFDFTFNQHYYSMGNFKLSIDKDTLSKKGRPTGQALCGDRAKVLTRAFRFMNQGWNIDEQGLLALLQDVVKDSSEVEVGNSSSESTVSQNLNLSGIRYTELDFFGTRTKEDRVNPSPLKAYTTETYATHDWGNTTIAVQTGTRLAREMARTPQVTAQNVQGAAMTMAQEEQRERHELNRALDALIDIEEL